MNQNINPKINQLQQWIISYGKVINKHQIDESLSDALHKLSLISRDDALLIYNQQLDKFDTSICLIDKRCNELNLNLDVFAKLFISITCHTIEEIKMILYFIKYKCIENNNPSGEIWINHIKSLFPKGMHDINSLIKLWDQQVFNGYNLTDDIQLISKK